MSIAYTLNMVRSEIPIFSHLFGCLSSNTFYSLFNSFPCIRMRFGQDGNYEIRTPSRQEEIQGSGRVTFVAMLSDLLYESSAAVESTEHRPAYLKFLATCDKEIVKGAVCPYYLVCQYRAAMKGDKSFYMILFLLY